MSDYKWGEHGWHKIEDGHYAKRVESGDLHVRRISSESARVRHHRHPKREYMWQDAHGVLWPTMREAMIASDGSKP